MKFMLHMIPFSIISLITIAVNGAPCLLGIPSTLGGCSQRDVLPINATFSFRNRRTTEIRNDALRNETFPLTKVEGKLSP